MEWQLMTWHGWCPYIDWFVISSFAVQAISSVISIIQSKRATFPGGWFSHSRLAYRWVRGARTQSEREQATGLYIKFVPKFIAIACRPTITQYFKDPGKLSVPSSCCSGMETQTSTRYFPMMVVSSLWRWSSDMILNACLNAMNKSLHWQLSDRETGRQRDTPDNNHYYYCP